MMHLKRTTSVDPNFIMLVEELDKELAIRDGEDHAFYQQFNGLENIRYVLLAYEEDEAIGCGAIKEYDKETMEIKRMFVPLKGRRKGVASGILSELEKWAGELGYSKCILETGFKQFEAIALYEKQGYKRIPNYGQYQNVKESFCFEKSL
jgi:GNAT superfamily N-acetyltransferase